MTDEPLLPPLPDPEPPSYETELMLVNYDWLRLACHLLSTLSLMLIALALLVRL